MENLQQITTQVRQETDNLLEFYQKMNEKTNFVRIHHNTDKDLYTVIYLHGGQNFNIQELKIARGLTLNKHGQIISRGFDKFFNYGQLNHYENYYNEEQKKRLCHIKDSNNITFQEKLDGTMIVLSYYKGDFLVTTSSTTENDYTEKAYHYFKDQKELLTYLKYNNVSLIFEYISPSNKIVVDYKEDEYILIGLVNNTLYGDSNPQAHLEIADRFNFKIPKTYEYSLDEILLKLKQDKGIEGWIALNEYGNRIKFKTDDWFELKEISDLVNNKKSIQKIIEVYFKDEIDDLLHVPIVVEINKILTQLMESANDLLMQYKSGKLKRKQIGQLKDKTLAYVTFNLIDHKEINVTKGLVDYVQLRLEI